MLGGIGVMLKAGNASAATIESSTKIYLVGALKDKRRRSLGCLELPRAG